MSRPSFRGLPTAFWVVVLRLFFLFQHSYIHPDENFQGPEILAGKIFGWCHRIPWEFRGSQPIRSLSLNWALYGVPSLMIEATFGLVRPVFIYYTIRALFAAGSWVLTDMAVDRLLRISKHQPSSKSNSIFHDRAMQIMMIHSTCYVPWVYQSHTFSNSVETVLVLWCLVAIQNIMDPSYCKSKHTRSIFLSLLIVIGLYNRVTIFAFLFVPLLRLFVVLKKGPLSLIILLGSSFTLFTLLLAKCEAILYGLPGLALIPLNNLRYNSNVSNLAIHGLHSRFQHLTVNIPQLLGPAIVPVLLSMRKYLITLPVQSALSGLVLLSFIPHQEARFLIPLVPLLLLNMDIDGFPRKLQKSFFVLWTVFNVSLAILMGSLHQAGVVPAQVFLSSYVGYDKVKLDGLGSAASIDLNRAPETFVWWNTYPPPTWLLGAPENTLKTLSTDELSMSDMHRELAAWTQDLLLDIMGTDRKSAQGLIEEILLQERRAILIAPTNQAVLEWLQIFEPISSISQLWSTTQHLSLDGPTPQMGLGIWQLDSKLSRRSKNLVQSS